MYSYNLEEKEFYDEELIDGYLVSSRLKHIWAIQLQLLHKFMRVCEKYNLKWFIAHGTLLGAVRHGGFIPWDDDIDVNMPREDYERLLDIASDDFEEPFYLQCDKKEINFLGFARIRYSRATAAFYGDIDIQCNKGIWLDIFPMDGVIEDEKRRKKQSKKLELYRALNIAKVYGKYYYRYYGYSRRYWIFLKTYSAILSFIHGENWLKKKFDEICCLGNDGNEVRTGIHCLRTDYECCYWYKSDYEETVMMNFMGIEVPVPKGYDRCLKIKWGNYMEFPPVEQRGYKHLEHIIDPYISYKDYPFHIFTEFPKYNRNRKVIIFGAGIACDDFLKRYERMYSIAYIVDNSKEKQGTKKRGYKIISKDDMYNVYDRNEMQIIICTSYFQEIIDQLSEKGVKEYYVYIKDRRYLTWIFLKTLF